MANTSYREVKLLNKDGLHARPASLFARTAVKFKSEIEVCARNKTVDGKSIIDLLTLGASKDTTLLIKAKGEDSEDALNSLEGLVKDRLKEDFMEKKKGVTVNPGIVIGDAYVLPAEGCFIQRHIIHPEEVQNEIKRLKNAIKEAKAEIIKLEKNVTDKLGQEIGEIFGCHHLLLEDKHLNNEFLIKIRRHNFSAEYAVSVTLRAYVKKFQEISDPYLSGRVSDIYDIEKRLLRKLFGEKQEDLRHLTKEVILVAHDLSPSQTASLDTQKVKGFVTDAGGRTSHTAIVAKALGIPAIVGMANVSLDVIGGDKIIIDGNEGIVIIRPDEKTLREYSLKEKEISIFEKDLATQLKDLPSVTLDGREILLLSNIEFPSEIKTSINNGASGIGLYRTEFLYMGDKVRQPTEEDHFNAYSQSVKELGDRSIVIRTCDLGGDKFALDEGYREMNPFMGQRSIRYCLEHIDIFKRQIRAILRASALGNVKILFPMISSIEELVAVKSIVCEVKDALAEKGTPFDKNIKIGIMVEVPSAAILADILAKKVDFFSIGTNDLIQYALAVDRNNEKVAHLYSPAHPAILRLLKTTIDAAEENNIGVTMCGEMGGELEYTVLLIGLGLKELSVVPATIPEIKRIVRSIKYEDAKRIAEDVFKFEDPKKISAFLKDMTKEILPEIFLDKQKRYPS